MNSPVVVLGATGQVGLFSIGVLLKTGRPVIAVTRDAPARPETPIEGLRRYDTAGFIERFRASGNEHSPRIALLSCGPVALARKLLEAEAGGAPGGWERAVVIGTTSLASKGASPDVNERDEIAAIGHALDAIRLRCCEGGIPLTVLHPTLIYGCGLDENLSRVYRFILRAGFAPLAKDAAGRRQPLHVADLAEAIVRALDADPPPRLESPVCGGSTLPFDAMIGSLFEAAGRPVRLLRVPGFIAPLVAGVSKLLPGAARVSGQMFSRQSRDLVFDDSGAREILQHAPRPFRPGEPDFRLPPRIERIRDALLAE